SLTDVRSNPSLVSRLTANWSLAAKLSSRLGFPSCVYVCVSVLPQKLLVAKEEILPEQHLKSHTAERPFPCSICDKRYKAKADLTRHLKTHGAKRSFRCSVCDNRYKAKADLTRHVKTHTAKRSFRCSVCDKRYKAKTDLTRHLKTHGFMNTLRAVTVCQHIFSLKQTFKAIVQSLDYSFTHVHHCAVYENDHCMPLRHMHV
uniref:C2H2-type domain-containing protein n=1 Tax=Myripristis murdjan TaxID=586833 RepID=A0A668A8B1_9TELE